MSRSRGRFALIGSLIVAVAVAIPPSRATVLFTETDVHHKPVIRWVLGANTQPSYPYAAGYCSTTPFEESVHYDPGSFPNEEPSCYWSVEATRVTVSFPETPDPSVIGTGNWLASGLFVKSCDRSVSKQDWAYYAVLVLDSAGNLWIDVGIYADNELNGVYYEICARTWQVSGLARETPVTLVMEWMFGILFFGMSLLMELKRLLVYTTWLTNMIPLDISTSAGTVFFRGTIPLRVVVTIFNLES